MINRIIFVCLVLVFIMAGCTYKNPENPCYDCRLQCPNADRTACVNDNKCECYYDDTSKDDNQSDLNKNKIDVADTLPSCGEKMDFLSVSPLKYGDFKNIIPLGNFNPSGHTFPTDHIYLALNRIDANDWNSGTVNVPVYMPGDVLITEIDAVKHLSDNPPFTDYDLSFYPCKELSFRFGHITSLSAEMLSEFNKGIQCDKEYETGGSKFQRCSNKNLNIKVSAGQKIGTAGGNPNQSAFDIWATDFRVKELEFAMPDRWSSNTKHTACPLNYFTNKEKEELYSLLGGWSSNKRTIEPICGTIEQDIKGTAQGAWFVQGTENTYPEDPHLALALDNVNPQINVFSVGGSIPGLDSKIYIFTPESTGEVNIAFAQVKPGKVYCYEQSDKSVDNNQNNDRWDFTIVLELLNETALKIEKQTSSKCRKPFKFKLGVLFER